MVELAREELDEIYGFAVDLGKEAGRRLLEAARLRTEDNRPKEAHVEKVNAVDLVTQTDEGEIIVGFLSSVNLSAHTLFLSLCCLAVQFHQSFQN